VSRYRLYGLALLILGAGGIVAGVLVHRWWAGPTVVVAPPVHGVTVVTVGVSALPPAIVTQYLTDPTNGAKLMAALAQVHSLTETIAHLRAEGSGPVQYIDRPVPGPPGQTIIDHQVHFSDGRLLFDSSSQSGTAHYSLTQTFEFQVALGLDKAGKPTAAVQGFELWPAGQRAPLTDAKTVLVTAAPTTPRWRFGLAIQAGLAAGVTSAKAAQYGGVLGLQWLRRGDGTAEGSTFSIATPVAFISGSGVEPGMLVASWNAARVLPLFRDIWLSPLVTTTRIGVAVSATF
jgi:hypothetical protein